MVEMVIEAAHNSIAAASGKIEEKPKYVEVEPEIDELKEQVADKAYYPPQKSVLQECNTPSIEENIPKSDTKIKGEIRDNLGNKFKVVTRMDGSGNMPRSNSLFQPTPTPDRGLIRESLRGIRNLDDDKEELQEDNLEIEEEEEE